MLREIPRAAQAFGGQVDDMKKVALVFVLAVIVPSLVLAWLAVRSLRDQQFILERQQSLLYQGVADAKAKDVQEAIEAAQHSFGLQVDKLIGNRDPEAIAGEFDDLLRRSWPLAQVGFCVSLSGQVRAPRAFARAEARKFLEDNGRFLANRESVEVYQHQKQGNQALNSPTYQNSSPQSSSSVQAESQIYLNNQGGYNNAQPRNVFPQQALTFSQRLDANEPPQQQVSKSLPAPAEFRQLIGEEKEGTVARFVDNQLNVLFWYRPPGDSQLVFGAQIAVARLGLAAVVQQVEPALRDEICVVLLDDTARPVAVSHPGFRAHWKRPFVATEIGEALPHWELAVYLLNPAKLSQSAHTLKLTLGLLIAILLAAIGIGSWLIVADLNRQLTLARQKTDFVSNVSHELKTPLTSIRMFSELLAEGRVADQAKQRTYLGIITAETARLTRLINNVLDFARLERGEKKYTFQPCDLVTVVRETAETYRPHLESNGFRFSCELPDQPIPVNGDRDALAQVVVNLLSNAEKYSEATKEITLRVARKSASAPEVTVQVLDRGLGVPRGSEAKIFEQFYRAHDSLGNGIQGSGLGLTLARQIAQAHGGEVVYAPREGGGSCFTLRLPVMAQAKAEGRNPKAEGNPKAETRS